MIDRRRVHELAAMDPGAGILDRMAAHNLALLRASSHERLKCLMSPPQRSGEDAMRSFPADLFAAELFECLSPRCEIDLRPVRDTHGSELVHELVQ